MSRKLDPKCPVHGPERSEKKKKKKAGAVVVKPQVVNIAHQGRVFRAIATPPAGSARFITDRLFWYLGELYWRADDGFNYPVCSLGFADRYLLGIDATDELRIEDLCDYQPI